MATVKSALGGTIIVEASFAFTDEIFIQVLNPQNAGAGMANGSIHLDYDAAVALVAQLTERLASARDAHRLALARKGQLDMRMGNRRADDGLTADQVDAETAADQVARPDAYTDAPNPRSGDCDVCGLIGGH